MKNIIALNKKARAILINGRPFVEYFPLGQWMGFRWGKSEISIQTQSKYSPENIWRTRLFIKDTGWNLDANWDLEILRNLNAALDEKLKCQEKRRLEEEKKLRQAKINLNAAQKFYGDLTLKELAN